MLEGSSQKIDSVLYLAVKEEEIISRLTSRWTCPKCSEVFNVKSRRTKVEGKCDKCGEGLVQREDDQEMTVRKRLMIYEHQTEPLVAYYRSQHEFHEVDGARETKAVTGDLLNHVEKTAAGNAEPQ